LLRSGRKIEAIKEVRMLTGMDLGSAKDLVESWELESQ
jgi:ribosomal protein L7/L12